MRFTNPGVAPVADHDGGISIPSWRAKWIAEKVQRVELECGCIEDLSIPALTLINTFDGTSIDCVVHHGFYRVVKKLKAPKTQYPTEPTF